MLNIAQPLPEKLTTRTKVIVRCPCGRESAVLYGNLPNTNSCGKCSWKPKEYWLTQADFGDLKLVNTNLPDEWPANSHQVFPFVCKCTRLASLKFQAVTSGNTRSCGKCSWKPKEYWLTEADLGKLTLIDENLPDEWAAGSNKRFRFICACGNSHSAIFQNVTTRSVLSCGKCNHKSREYWAGQQWGALRLNDVTFPASLPKFSMRQFNFFCTKCEKTQALQFSHVTQGFMETCGRCEWKSVNFWEDQHWGILTLVKAQTEGDISPMSNRKLRFSCGCGNEITTRFADVNDGSIHSCGCLQIGENEFSEENEVRDFVKSLDPTTCKGSHRITPTRKLKYDVYIKDKKLAVEYHGLRFHSEELKHGTQDHEKFLIAQEQGDTLIQIYSDEWKNKQPIMKSLLQDRIAPLPKTRIKPTFEIKVGRTPKEALRFLDNNHYLGAAGGSISVTARHNNEVVGVWVFKKRKGEILWHRACWDRKYKSWNPHEKALKMALPLLKEMGFTRMVTFSDNRFHTGKLYEKLGFTFEEELKPDYGYAKGNKRVSKESFRVPAGVDEVSAAKSKGWYQIFDSGKRRYSFSV